MPHKMDCSNQSQENDKKVNCRRVYYNRYYAENKERILTWQKRWRTDNVEILKARRKKWYENNREQIVRSQRAYKQKNKEHVTSYQRQYRKNNRERLNKYWRDYYANNKEWINQRLRSKKQTEIGQNITHFGTCDQGSEKVRVETSPVPSPPPINV
jgi:hypothetical protein